MWVEEFQIGRLPGYLIIEFHFCFLFLYMPSIWIVKFQNFIIDIVLMQILAS